MNKNFRVSYVLFVLVGSLLANSLAWAFHGEIFMHVLDNHQTVSIAVSAAHEDHYHNDSSSESNSDSSKHTCLNAAYQPVFFTKFPLSLLITDTENLTDFFSPQIPEYFLDSPFRPPRKIFHA